MRISVVFSVFATLVLVLSACGAESTPVSTQDVSLIQTQAAQTVVVDLTQNAPPPATQAPPSTAVTEEIPTQEPPPGPTPDPNIPVALLPVPAPGEPGATAAYNTLIYGGPGEDYVVYGSFVGGQTAKVVGKSEDSLWWAVSVPVAPDGNGWVDAGWVIVSNVDGVPVLPTPPVPATTEILPPGPDDPQATTLANVYVRSGPATNFPAYGIAKTGATGRVIGKSEDGQWWVVRINPEKVGVGHGWMMAQYMSAKNVTDVQTITTPESAETSPPPTPSSDAPSGTALEPVNVRSGPGTNYPVLVVAPAGASGEITGKSTDGQWWQVKISTQYSPTGFGWVSAGFGYTQNTENVPVVEAPPPPPVVEPTPSAVTGTGCSLVSQTPSDGTVLKPGAAFETTWVIKNSGTDKWDQDEYDIAYVGAVDNTALHTGPDRFDLEATIDPGWTYTFWLDMLAPIDPGIYGELWQITLGNQSVCQFYIYIEVR